MEKVRCFGTGDSLYEAYHDQEWGRPPADSPDEHELFEQLCLESFQSGLSWLTVLRKRENFREAFAGFAPAEVARFDTAKVEQLLTNVGIIRHRGKIEATINNARALLAVHAGGERLATIIGAYAVPAVQRRQTLAEVPAQTPQSQALSKELKKRGFAFVGPTTMYALMQDIGVVDDHLATCWLVQS